jgi:hypothetical protein
MNAAARPLLYGPLVSWYPLLDPPAEHRQEVGAYERALMRGLSPPPETLLELGAGAGHNALHLKQRFRCTLTDTSPDMQALSRALNPECEHVAGDMHTLRLGRSFGAVLVHDAVAYMTSEADLRAAAETAFVHCLPGARALFTPNYVRENFHESTRLHEAEDGDRALRCLEWTWDPDPEDETYTTEYAFLLREGTAVTAVHDRHVEGLFARQTWIALLASVGFEVDVDSAALDWAADDIFVCRSPLAP